MYAIYSSKGSDRQRAADPDESRSRRRRPNRKTLSSFSAAAADKNDWKLQLAVDDLLQEHHDAILLPKLPCTIHHRDSFSTISTRESSRTLENSKLCRIKRDERYDNEFVPIEISFPSSSSQMSNDDSSSSLESPSNHRPRPLLQKPSKLLPDSKSIFDYCDEDYDDDDLDDIVYVPAEEDMTSETSSMKVVRTISRRLSSVVEKTEQRIEPKFHNNNRRHLRRQPSRGMDSAAPLPLRRGMHQLSIRINTRFEI